MCRQAEQTFHVHDTAGRYETAARDCKTDRLDADIDADGARYIPAHAKSDRIKDGINILIIGEHDDGGR
ncbi:hypothetical protein EN41_21320 [Agrobacterium tumefaciens]|nr:hypothetical protein EN41_21320 [Agrobacterium tumefaciens]